MKSSLTHFTGGCHFKAFKQEAVQVQLHVLIGSVQE